MQTTVPIEGSSAGDVAAHAREAGDGAVAKPDTPDSAALPEMSGAAASAVATKNSCRECGSIDIAGPGSAVNIPRISKVSLQYPVQRRAPAWQNSRDG